MKVRSILFALLAVLIPCLAYADMMGRTTAGDMAFFFAIVLLVPVFGILLLTYGICVFAKKESNMKCYARSAALVAGIALCMAILGAKFYYKYYGYGAYKKAIQQMRSAPSLLRLIESSCQQYAIINKHQPSNMEEVLKAFKEFGYKSVECINNRGEVVDPWGTPVRCLFKDNKRIFSSAGFDCKFDTEDDVVYP